MRANPILRERKNARLCFASTKGLKCQVVRDAFYSSWQLHRTRAGPIAGAWYTMAERGRRAGVVLAYISTCSSHTMNGVEFDFTGNERTQVLIVHSSCMNRLV